jgi:hypothetical protein
MYRWDVIEERLECEAVIGVGCGATRSSWEDAALTATRYLPTTWSFPSGDMILDLLSRL